MWTAITMRTMQWTQQWQRDDDVPLHSLSRSSLPLILVHPRGPALDTTMMMTCYCTSLTRQPREVLWDCWEGVGKSQVCPSLCTGAVCADLSVLQLAHPFDSFRVTACCACYAIHSLLCPQWTFGGQKAYRKATRSCGIHYTTEFSAR